MRLGTRRRICIRSKVLSKGKVSCLLILLLFVSLCAGGSVFGRDEDEAGGFDCGSETEMVCLTIGDSAHVSLHAFDCDGECDFHVVRGK